MKPMTPVLALMVAVLGLVVACEPNYYGKPSSTSSKTEGASTEGASTALKAPAGSPGWMENNAGVASYQQERWDVAADHFRKALKTDPNLAEAHFNLGLALDKMGKHGDARTSFKKAAELGWKSSKTEITESPILKQHLGY